MNRQEERKHLLKEYTKAYFNEALGCVRLRQLFYQQRENNARDCFQRIKW